MRGPGKRPAPLRAERSPAAGFLVAGVGFLALAAALSPAGRLWHWPWAGIAALHLALIGGVSQLVLGAAQSFALMLLANLLRTARAPGGPLSIAARLVLAGQLCLGAGMALASCLAPLIPRSRSPEACAAASARCWPVGSG